MVRRRHRAVGEETPMLTPNLSPVRGARNYRPLPPSPLAVKTNSTTRKAEHTRPYSQHLPKLLQKKNFSTTSRYFQTAQLRGCLLVQPWQIHGHFNWKQSTWLKVSPDQWWRRTKTHWFPLLSSSTSHRHDFIPRAAAKSQRTVLCPRE